MGAFCTSLSATTRTAAASATRPKASQHGSPPSVRSPSHSQRLGDFGLCDRRAFSFDDKRSKIEGEGEGEGERAGGGGDYGGKGEGTKEGSTGKPDGIAHYDLALDDGFKRGDIASCRYSLSRSNHEAHNTALSLFGSTGDEMLAFRDRWLQRNRILKGRSHHSIGASSDQRCGSIWSLPLVITSGREEMSTSGVPAVGSTHERARHERTTSPGSLPVSAPLAWVIDGCGLLGRRRSFDLIIMSARHNHGFMEEV
ncbi:hypothetical protein GW17_00000929 [Ensete ventricosum]|nr:hypothetical protein GW17_00000929 [Ensete ventricosum]